MNSYETARRELALALMDVGAVLTRDVEHPSVVTREGPNGLERGFILKGHEGNLDARLSPILFNFRTPDNPRPGPLVPGFIRLGACLMRGLELSKEKKLRYDAVAGIPRAGDPFAREFATLANTRCLQLWKWEHDGQRQIGSFVGDVPPDVETVLLVENVVSGANSTIEAIQNIRDESMRVTDVIALVDREQGGRERLKELGCTLHAVYTTTEFLDICLQAGEIGREIYDETLAYLAASHG